MLSASGGRTDDAGAFNSESDEVLSEIAQTQTDVLGTPEQIQVASAGSSGYLKVGDGEYAFKLVVRFFAS